MLFFLTACEPSGDRLGATIIRALQIKFPQAKFIGVAGPLMREAGCIPLHPQEDLAVMGFIAVLKRCIPLLKVRQFIKQQALKAKPIAYIGLDAPDFNLPIEYQLKKQGIKTVHVNSPTVWAWRASRIKKIKCAVDLMLTLFPFETAIYEKHHIPVRYIGHPLASDIPRHSQKIIAQKKLGLDPQKKYLCLMPGSRSGDLKYLAPIFLHAAKHCAFMMPNLQILVPLINEQCAVQFRALCEKAHATQLPLNISIGNAHEVLQASHVALVKSGTGTLEAMLCQTPMVVAYKLDAFSFWLATKLITIKHVSLPNILANQSLVPELLQNKATAKHLATACLTLFNESNQDALLREFDRLHQTLAKNSAYEAAEAIAEILK